MEIIFSTKFKQILIFIFSVAFSVKISYGQDTTPVEIDTTNSEKLYLNVTTQFIPSGYMGDGELSRWLVFLEEKWGINPLTLPTCLMIKYKPGTAGWAGIFWQNEHYNWGDKPGINLAKKDYNKITFWARGEKGGEIVEFKAGGINAPNKKYKDSFNVSTGKVILKKEWKKFMISLKGHDLSSVIGGFCWVASKNANPDGIIFYLDDIHYEN